MSAHSMEPEAGILRQARQARQVVDPVCGMKVDPAKTPHHAEHEGTIYHFCSAGCREKFQRDPEAYLKRAPAPKTPVAPAGAVYTCPMHPEVVRDGPGSCPI